MSSEKAKKRKFQINDAHFEASYINEQIIRSSNINTKAEMDASVNLLIDDETFTISSNKNAINAELTWNTLKAEYDSGASINNISTKLKNEILNNKDNPEYIKSFISTLMSDVCTQLYDSNLNNTSTGDNLDEMLQTMLSVPNGEELKGFVCSNIHQFGMRLLNQCGINAVVICGAEAGNSHAALLYQNNDGTYVFCNYSSTMTLKAKSIKDAVKAVYKYSNLNNAGFIKLVDDKGSYKEFALKEEACWGKELDKRCYNNQSLFEHNITDKSSIDGNISYSNTGNISAEFGTTQVNNDNVKPVETRLTLGYKKNGEGELFNNSVSAGFKFERQGINNQKGIYFDIKAVVDYTRGQNPTYPLSSKEIDKQITEFMDKYSDLINKNCTYEDIRSEIYSKLFQCDNNQSNFFTGFFRGVFGKESHLSNNLKNAGQVVINYVANRGVTNTVDARVTIEDGVELTSRHNNTVFQNSISGGVVTDLKETNGAQNIGIQVGGKVNLSSGFKTVSYNNCIFGANAKASAVITPIASDYEVNGNIFGMYNPENSNVTIFGQVNAGVENQKLRIGNFNQQTENIVTLGASIGAQINKNTSVNIGYNANFDKLNTTKNKSIVSLGLKVNL